MSAQEVLTNVDHHNIEAAKMLSNAVTLLDQKSTLSEDDIRAKKDILNAICRLTTIPKMNPMKINELLSMILDKVQVQKLLHLRRVCSHWKLVIEAICRQKKCLKLHSYVGEKQQVTFLNRFLGTIKLECFVELKLQYTNALGYGHNQLKENFCTFLGQIFSSVDQLIVDLELDEDSITNLFNMLNTFLPNLNTLSLNNVDNADLSTTRIDKLKRLDVFTGCHIEPNSELISQLEHFSCVNTRGNILDDIPQLGLNCTSFHWGLTSSVEFDRYIQRNSAQVLANITHLGLFMITSSDESLIRLICTNFPSLQALSVPQFSMAFIFNSATCDQLAKLSHLSTFCFGSTLFDLDSLKSTRTRLSSIRVLNLSNFGITETIDPFTANYSDFDGDRFCRVLASIFPNIEKLAIFSLSEVVHDKIQENLNKFRKSVKLKIIISDEDSFHFS